MEQELTKPRKTYSGIAARVLKLMCNGVTQSQAANSLGIDDTYVSQLASEADFKAYIADALTKSAQDAIDIDSSWVEIERTAVDKLKKLLAYEMNPDRLLRVAKEANIAKRKVPLTPLGNDVPSELAPVRLQMPAILVREFIVNPNNEVVALGDQGLVTLNSSSMNSLLEESRKRKQLEVLEGQFKDVTHDKRAKVSNPNDFSDL